MKRILFTWGAVIALALAVFAVPSAKAQPAEPPMTGVRAWYVSSFIASTPLTQTTTINTASPLLRGGLDVSEAANWAVVDVFATATISDTGVVTVTPQFSADQTNWTGALRVLEGVTNTTSVAQQIVLTASGTKYIRLPVYGTHVRINLQSTGVVTPMVRLVFRNGQ